MTESTLFPDDRCTGCGQTPKGDGCWVCLTETGEEVGTGAGGDGDPAQTEATLWVNCSMDCPEAPAQAHLLATCPDHPTIPRADCVCPYPGEETA